MPRPSFLEKREAICLMRKKKEKKSHCLGEREAMLAVGRSAAVVPSLLTFEGGKSTHTEEPD